MRSNKITKSIRLTPEQVAYIDSLPGKDFTAKLSGYLEECRKGEKARCKQIAYYDKLIENRKKEIQAMNDIAMTLRSFRNDVVRANTFFLLRFHTCSSDRCAASRVPLELPFPSASLRRKLLTCSADQQGMESVHISQDGDGKPWAQLDGYPVYSFLTYAQDTHNLHTRFPTPS